jgi:hypothetical protein
VKTESGSPSDLAGGLHRDDGARDEDPKLRAMRAVWLEMRDEDPPERGLAELLAAARTKAQAMEVRPTLWQRLIAGLARPPALALATVLVLVGGAVLVGRRGVDVPAPASAPVSSGMASPPVRPAELPAAVPGETAGDLKEVDDGVAPAQDPPNAAPADDRAGAATKAGPAGGGGVPSATPVPAKLDVRQPAPPRVPKKPKPADMAPPDRYRSAADTGGFTAGTGEVQKPRVSDAPPPKPAPSADARGSLSPPPAREQAGASEDVTTTASSGRDESPLPADRGESAKKVERVDTAKDTKAPAEAKVPLDQLYKQCESAAQRGDCATVRSLVGRITKSDRSYRARVAKDSPVAKCLAE